MKHLLSFLLFVAAQANALDVAPITDELNDADYVVVGSLKINDERFHFHTARGHISDTITHYRGAEIFCIKVITEWTYADRNYSKAFEYPAPERMKPVQIEGEVKAHIIQVMFKEEYLESLDEGRLLVWGLKRNPFSEEYYLEPIVGRFKYGQEQVQAHIDQARLSIKKKSEQGGGINSEAAPLHDTP